MIYVYDAAVLADVRNRSLWFYNEYNVLKNIVLTEHYGINGLFYFYIHDVYDPLFLWNIEEANQLKIEFGNHRFAGRAIRAKKDNKEIWLHTKLVSPTPWDLAIADIKVGNLEKIIDAEFPSYSMFENSADRITIKGDMFDLIVRPYIKHPSITQNIFSVKTDNAYQSFVKSKLPYNYTLKNNGRTVTTLGDSTKPTKAEYDIKDYDGLIDTMLTMFIDAEKELL